MAQIPEKIDKVVNDYLQEVKKHIAVQRAVLYGSYAKGNYSDESDIDIAIFSDNFKTRKFVEATTFLFSLARKYRSVCIEPVGFDIDDLQDDNPFIKEILKDGLEIRIGDNV